MPDPLPAATVARIEQLARQGESLNAIAREVGCSRSSVTKYAPPGSFDRTTTAAAVQAHKLDAAARRALLTDRLLTEVESLLNDMRGEHLAYGWFGKDGDYQERRQPEPPPADKRALASAAASLLNQHLRLVDHDTDGGLDEAKTLLHGFMTAVTQRAAELPPQDTG